MEVNKMRNVFYSFHYGKDIMRAMVVRNQWVTKGGQKISGIVDKAEFEEVKRKGDAAIKRWIDSQMLGTSVTVVLIGETLEREYVQYEIMKSIDRGNAILGIHISQIKDANTGMTSKRGNVRTIIGWRNNMPIYFDDVCYAIHDYIADNGYENLASWVEMAAKSMGK